MLRTTVTELLARRRAGPQARRQGERPWPPSLPTTLSFAAASHLIQFHGAVVLTVIPARLGNWVSKDSQPNQPQAPQIFGRGCHLRAEPPQEKQKWRKCQQCCADAETKRSRLPPRRSYCCRLILAQNGLKPCGLSQRQGRCLQLHCRIKAWYSRVKELA